MPDQRPAWRCSLDTRFLLVLGAVLTLAVGWAGQRPAVPAPRASLYDGSYGFLWWAHGFRRRSPDGRLLLCVRTSRYGMALDVEKPALAHFGALKNAPPYEQAVGEPNEVVFGLPPESLRLEARVGPTSYRCIAAARDTRDYMTYPVRIIEQGRFCQRFDVQQLEFADAAGARLDADGRLEVVAWPDRIAFMLELTARRDMPDGTAAIGIGATPSGGSEAAGPWKAGEIRRAVAVRTFAASDHPEQVIVRASDLLSAERKPTVSSDDARGWIRIGMTGGPWRADQDFDHYDRYRLSLTNPDAHEQVVRLLFARDEPGFGITGMVAMLRESDGRPTGIPVQLSKNWHRLPDRRLLYEGPWFHGYTMLRLPPRSERELELTIAYARWGGVPSASHAQLCLIGWGMNQLWDQAAIGSWGESICYDPDINLQRSMIDDVRPLMVTRMGTKDGKWGWTHNVGGGDFLVLMDADGKRQPLTRMRPAYLSQGPNLTQVVYAGITPGGEIEARIEVSTPRTDDINRAYHRIRYEVRKPIRFSRLAFYEVGADNYNDHRFGSMAYGDIGGMREEWPVVAGGLRYHRQGIPLTGNAPWVSLHDAIHIKPGDGAWAARGMVVRRWKARLGGKAVMTPHLASYGTQNGPHSANAELAPPPGLSELRPGDFVEADIELVILPVAAGDYYGPDEALRQALTKDANTWRMVWREARGNDLRVRALSGRLLRRTPVVVRSSNGSTAAAEITGGLGHVPVTFTGLRNPDGFSLYRQIGSERQVIDQSVQGHDWYQTDYDPTARAYALTFTLPLGRMSGGRPITVGLTRATQPSRTR